MADERLKESSDRTATAEETPRWLLAAYLRDNRRRTPMAAFQTLLGLGGCIRRRPTPR